LVSQPATPAAASDLISFLKALPDCWMRRGIRFPQWRMLLVGMERFAKRHRHTLNELLGTDFGKSPSDSTFRLLLAQLDVSGFETLLRDWMRPSRAWPMNLTPWCVTARRFGAPSPRTTLAQRVLLAR